MKFLGVVVVILALGPSPSQAEPEPSPTPLDPTPIDDATPEASPTPLDPTPIDDATPEPSPTPLDPTLYDDATPEEAPTPLQDYIPPEAPEELPPRPDRYPPPKDALILFFPGFRGADTELSTALSLTLAEGLHGKKAYHVIELRDAPDVGPRPAREIWAQCEDEMGCLTLMGDRAQADISLGGRVSEDENGQVKVVVTLYDQEGGEEISGLELHLPGLNPAPSPSPIPEGVTPSPSLEPLEEGAEGDPPSRVSPGAAEGLILALDARLMPIAAAKKRVVPPEATQPWQDAPTPPPLEGSEVVTLTADAAALAETIRNSRDKREYTEEDAANAEAEREILGLSTQDYIRYKRKGMTEREWRKRQEGRSGRVALRLDGGFIGGEVAQQYDGIVLMGDVSSDILEKYARLIPAPGRSAYGRLGVAIGMLPDLEAELRVGFGQSKATVRTLQVFQEDYCPEGGADCVSAPKEEVVPTRIFTMEWLGRYYFRRPWDVKPYVSGGVQLIRLQDIPSAYDLHSTFSFPAIYDPFPALFTVGATGAAGVLWQAAPKVALTAEVPMYLRLVSGAFEPLHYYATEPLVQNLSAQSSPRIATGLTIGFHFTLR